MTKKCMTADSLYVDATLRALAWKTGLMPNPIISSRCGSWTRKFSANPFGLLNTASRDNGCKKEVVISSDSSSISGKLGP